MAGPIDRTWFNTLIDDDGSGATGTIWDKAQVDGLLDSVDAALGPCAVPAGGPGSVQFNDGGVLGGAAALTYDKATGRLTTAGVVFPGTAIPSADPTTLDDYREGTFTPVFLGTGGQSGQVYAAQVGQYVKVGRTVTVQVYVAISSKGTFTGEIAIGGLPFQASGLAGSYQPCGNVLFHNLAMNVAGLFLRLGPGEINPTVFYMPAGGGTSNSGVGFPAAGMNDALNMQFVMTYLTNS